MAFETLDDNDGKPSMVIRESLRNIRTTETVNCINDAEADRNIMSKFNTNI